MMGLFFVGSARHPRVIRRTSRKLYGLDRRHDGVVFFSNSGMPGLLATNKMDEKVNMK